LDVAQDSGVTIGPIRRMSCAGALWDYHEQYGRRSASSWPTWPRSAKGLRGGGRRCRSRATRLAKLNPGQARRRRCRSRRTSKCPAISNCSINPNMLLCRQREAQRRPRDDDNNLPKITLDGLCRAVPVQSSCWCAFAIQGPTRPPPKSKFESGCAVFQEVLSWQNANVDTVNHVSFGWDRLLGAGPVILPC